MITSELNRKPTENEQQYLWRLGQAKEAGTIDQTWDEIADLINAEFRPDTPFKESPYRKSYSNASLFWNQVFSKYNNGAEYEKGLQAQRDELHMLKKQYSDQRREYVKLLDVDARWQNLTDKMVESAQSLAKTKPLFKQKELLVYGEREAVLVFNDWHYGMVADNIFNTYNTTICEKRVESVVNKAISALRLHDVGKVHIILLGDATHGAIHTSCRVASSENACDQLMMVSEIIADAIHEISKHVDCVDVHSTYGNHMRTIQRKKDSIHSDNMEKIIPWWLQQRFIDREDIRILDSNLHEFLFINILGHTICATHGDLDRIKNFGVLANTIFSKLYGETVDYAILADKHHIESFEGLGIETLLCGSLCGTDEYSNNNRLYSKPSQMLMIFNAEEGRECIYNIIPNH